jgi:hypothetical protein
MSRKGIVIITETIPIDGQRHSITTASEHLTVISYNQFTFVGNHRGVKADVIMIPKTLSPEKRENAVRIAQQILCEHADGADRIVYY